MLVKLNNDQLLWLWSCIHRLCMQQITEFMFIAPFIVLPFEQYTSIFYLLVLEETHIYSMTEAIYFFIFKYFLAPFNYLLDCFYKNNQSINLLLFQYWTWASSQNEEGKASSYRPEYELAKYTHHQNYTQR